MLIDKVLEECKNGIGNKFFDEFYNKLKSSSPIKIKVPDPDTFFRKYLVSEYNVPSYANKSRLKYIDGTYYFYSFKDNIKEDTEFIISSDLVNYYKVLKKDMDEIELNKVLDSNKTIIGRDKREYEKPYIYYVVAELSGYDPISMFKDRITVYNEELSIELESKLLFEDSYSPYKVNICKLGKINKYIYKLSYTDYKVKVEDKKYRLKQEFYLI